MALDYPNLTSLPPWTKPFASSRIAAITSFVPCPKAYEGGTWDIAKNKSALQGVVPAEPSPATFRRILSLEFHPSHSPSRPRAPRAGAFLSEVACRQRWRHDPLMGRDRGEPATPDLFSTQTVRDSTLSRIGPIPATQATADASSQRHVLPKDLRTAVKHLSDGELDLLHAATLEEMGQRGRLGPSVRTTKPLGTNGANLPPGGRLKRRLSR